MKNFSTRHDFVYSMLMMRLCIIFTATDGPVPPPPPPPPPHIIINLQCINIILFILALAKWHSICVCKLVIK